MQTPSGYGQQKDQQFALVLILRQRPYEEQEGLLRRIILCLIPRGSMASAVRQNVVAVLFYDSFSVFLAYPFSSERQVFQPLLSPSLI